MRSFRLLHTADWHLGQTLHGIPRDAEHACFLDWLIDRIGEHRAMSSMGRIRRSRHWHSSTGSSRG